MTAVDDLTELVERAAAAEKVVLASKWREQSDVQVPHDRAPVSPPLSNGTRWGQTRPSVAKMSALRSCGRGGTAGRVDAQIRGHSAACHAQMYTTGALLRHGSDQLKATYLPLMAKGELRLQAFSITGPAAGSDTTSIITTAERDGDHYVITGHKNWTSRILESDLALVLARTSHKTENRTRGLTLFLVDLRQVRAEQPDTLEVIPVRALYGVTMGASSRLDAGALLCKGERTSPASAPARRYYD
jgi:alkylation response protein AidB-like acyl-CoA dehydrogenase